MIKTTLITTLVAVAIVAVFSLPSSSQAQNVDSDNNTKDILALAVELDLTERLWLHKEIAKSITKDVVTPDSKWSDMYPDLTGDDAGLCVLTERDTIDFDGIPGLRGGGAYWSFTDKSNDYNRDSHLEYMQGKFHSGFAGGNSGVITKLSVNSLAEATIDAVPEDLTAVEEYDRRTHGRQLIELERKYGQPKAAVGGVYVVRCVNWNESDVLAVFEVLEIENARCTLAWKVLKRYHQPER